MHTIVPNMDANSNSSALFFLKCLLKNKKNSSEFKSWYKDKKSLISQLLIKKAFEKLGGDGIEEKEFVSSLTNLGYTDLDAADIFAEMDDNCDENLSFDEIDDWLRGNQSCCSSLLKCCATSESDNVANYVIKYSYPVISSLFPAITGSVEFQFSSISIGKLINALKRNSCSYHGNVRIIFGNSLQLLGVREIISLMQACSEQKNKKKEKAIQLLDITQKGIWSSAFQNMEPEQDVRLYSNTFDDTQKKQPLLISLYKTEYDNENFDLLKLFIKEHDVPINISDKDNNTIIQHLDKNGKKVILNALRPGQTVFEKGVNVFEFSEKTKNNESDDENIEQKNNNLTNRQKAKAISDELIKNYVKQMPQDEQILCSVLD